MILIIIVYIIIVFFLQIYSLNSMRINYLKNLTITKLITHLIWPVIRYNLPNNEGFYSTIGNVIVFEIYIKKELRGKGLGKKLAGDLIDKYKIFSVNSNTTKMFKSILNDKNYNFINLKETFLIKN